MNARGILFVILAVLLAAGTAIAFRTYLSSQQAMLNQPKPEAPTADNMVLVAATDMPTGSFIKDTDLKWQPWPKDGLDASFITQDKGTKPADYAGAVVRRGLLTGEPVTAARVVRPGDRGFLAAVLEPGMRAVAVPVSAITGVAGLVFPGDRVDIILTHSFSDQTDPTGSAKVSETVLENVRILAIDQKVDSSTDKNQANVGRTATIEVTPKQAEIINVAMDMGQLSLSLRSLKKNGGAGQAGSQDIVDVSPEPTLGTTYSWDSDASVVLSNRARLAAQAPAPTVAPQPAPEPAPQQISGRPVTVQVVQGSKSSDLTFSIMSNGGTN